MEEDEYSDREKPEANTDWDDKEDGKKPEEY